MRIKYYLRDKDSGSPESGTNPVGLRYDSDKQELLLCGGFKSGGEIWSILSLFNIKRTGFKRSEDDRLRIKQTCYNKQRFYVSRVRLKTFEDRLQKLESLYDVEETRSFRRLCR